MLYKDGTFTAESGKLVVKQENSKHNNDSEKHFDYLSPKKMSKLSKIFVGGAKSCDKILKPIPTVPNFFLLKTIACHGFSCFSGVLDLQWILYLIPVTLRDTISFYT